MRARSLRFFVLGSAAFGGRTQEARPAPSGRSPKRKAPLRGAFLFGGPEETRTLDLSDANESKAMICIDF